MDVKRQQGGADQGDLFDEAFKAALCHGVGGEGGTGPATAEESQAPTVWDHERALTRHLMEAVCGAANLDRAYKRVKGNGGAPGVAKRFGQLWLTSDRTRLACANRSRGTPTKHRDDCNIYVRSQAAGERVMASVTAFLEGKLRLKVNQRKSAVAPVGERQFLGHRLGKRGSLGIGRKSLDRAKDRLREATRRNRGISLERMVADANRFIIGWVTYYRNARCRSTLLDLDGWLRRKVRCVRIKQCKSPSTLAAFLRKQGVRERPARQLASSGKGWWRLSNSEQAKRAMPIEWLDNLGLVSMAGHHAALNSVGNRRGT